MCGSATLAIVVSSTCNNTAIITPMVTMIRSPAGSGWVAIWAGVSSAIGGLLLLAVEIDVGCHGQAGDHRPRWRSVKRYPDGHALSHFDPVPVRILRRKQRELAAGSGADALDVAFEFFAAISVDFDGRMLAGGHACKVLLLEVRFDPGALAVHEAHHPDAEHRHLADLQLVGILDDAIHRRADVGALEIELGLVDRGLRLGDLWLLSGSDRSTGVRGASARVGKLRLGRAHLVHRILIVGLGREAL